MSDKVPSIKIQGRDYVQVATRVQQFREIYPLGASPAGCFVYERIALPDGRVGFFCHIYIDSTLYASGYAEQPATSGDGKNFGGRWAEKVQTSATGRALALVGFGTDDLLEDDNEEANFLADSPRKAAAPVVEEWVEGQGGWFVAHTIKCVKTQKGKTMYWLEAGHRSASTMKPTDIGGYDAASMGEGETVDVTGLNLRVEAVVSGQYTNIKRVYVHVADNAQKPVTPQAQSAPNRTGQTTAGWPAGDPATINRDDETGFRATVKLQTQDSTPFTAICMSRAALTAVEAANDFVPCYEVSTGMAKFWIVDP